MRGVRGLTVLVLSVSLFSGVVLLARQRSPVPPALDAMAATERAFAARAGVVGWKQAFLDYFAESAVGFDGDKAVSAREQLQGVPDPPKDLQLLWEPRYGDVAASGDLGWLTGPSTTINPARNNGTPRYGNYASVWKKQVDGTFKVVLDVGVGTPSAPAFAPGFVRAPSDDRYSGSDSVAAATDALKAADTALNMAARSSQRAAFEGRLAAGARLHRTGVLPLTDSGAILEWLGPQRPYADGEARFAEVAASRDLGYTYGVYSLPPAGASPAELGFYARVWVRGRDGQWKVALDVMQPQ